MILSVLLDGSRCYSRGMEKGIVGERVRGLRDAHDWSRAEVARRMEAAGEKTHQSHITAIEAGTKSMSPRKLRVLAEVLETNTSYLVGETDDASPRSDLEDQVVAGIADGRSRRIVQEIVDLVAMQSYEDQLFVLDAMRRLLRPKTVAEALGQTEWLLQEIEKEAREDLAVSRLLSRLRSTMLSGGPLDINAVILPNGTIIDLAHAKNTKDAVQDVV